MAPNDQVAHSIDQLMFMQGKTNKELAQLLDITEPRASIIRSGKAELKLNQFFLVADWLQVSMNELRNGFELVPKTA